MQRFTSRIIGAVFAITLSAPVTAASLPQIALIIDDLGDQSASGTRIINLPGPVACAFLPGSPHTARLARLAHQRGKEVLLHLPMQPSARATAHPASVTVDDSRGELLAALRDGLDAVPFATGVNNHQGSVMTQHPGHMAWLMEGIRENGELFFVDSYTSARSVAFDIAREQNLPTAKRDVFLDTDRSPEAIRHQFRRLIRIAKSRGSALGIGHPYPETLALLEAELPHLASRHGVELVSVDELISVEHTRLLMVEATANDSGRVDLVESTSAVGHASPRSAPRAAPVLVAKADNAELADLRRRSADLSAELKALRQQNDELSGVIRKQQSLSAELAELKQQLDSTSLGKSAVETRLRVASETRDRLQQERDAALADAERLRNDLASERQVSTDAMGSVSQLRAELQHERNQRAALTEQIAGLNSLRGEASVTERELAETRQQLVALRSRFELARSERDTAITEREQLRVARDAAVVERKQFMAARDAAVAEREQIARQRDAAVAERDTALAQRETASTQALSALAAQSSAEQARANALRSRDAKQAELVSRIAALEDENRQLKADSNGRQVTQQDSQQRIGTLSMQLGEVERRNRELETARADLQRQLALKDSALLRLEKEKQQTTAALTERERQLNQVNNALTESQEDLQLLQAAVTRKQEAREARLAAVADTDPNSVKLSALRSVISDALQERRMLETGISDVEAKLRVSDRPRLHARLKELQGDLRTTNAKIRALEKVRNLARQEADEINANVIAAKSAARLRLDTDLSKQ